MQHVRSKQRLVEFFESRARQAERWRAKNSFYYQWLARMLRFYVPPGKRVLEVGSGLGDLVAAVSPRHGVGMDFSPGMVAAAQRRHPGIRFIVGDADSAVPLRETFDVIIASDLLGYLDDIQAALEQIRVLCHDASRLVITQYNRWWEPVLHLGALLGFNQPKPLHNWLSGNEVTQLATLAGFEVVSRGFAFLCPKRWWGIGDAVNRTVARLPIVRRLCLIQYFIARPVVSRPIRRYAVTVILPVARPLPTLPRFVQQLPTLGSQTEIILAVPAGRAGPRAAAEAAAARLANRRAIRVLPFSPAAGWWSSVSQAAGDLIVVLPADGSLDPAVLEIFYRVIAEAKADLVSGTRLVYPSALPWSRRLGHRVYSGIFSFAIGQRVTDAACGAFALRRADAIALPLEGLPLTPDAGALPLLTAAAQRGWKIAEVPVHYRPPSDVPPMDRAAPSIRTWWRCARRHLW